MILAAEERLEYKKAVKTHNLSQQGMEIIKGLRGDLDHLGEMQRKMIVAPQPYKTSVSAKRTYRDPACLFGNAQLWSKKSVPRQPAFVAAGYSLLLLAGLKEFGPGRTHDFVPLPKWRKKATRPSALDLITLLRKEISEAPITDFLKRNIAKNITAYAYT